MKMNFFKLLLKIIRGKMLVHQEFAQKDAELSQMFNDFLDNLAKQQEWDYRMFRSVRTSMNTMLLVLKEEAENNKHFKSFHEFVIYLTSSEAKKNKNFSKIKVLHSFSGYEDGTGCPLSDLKAIHGLFNQNNLRIKTVMEDLRVVIERGNLNNVITQSADATVRKVVKV